MSNFFLVPFGISETIRNFHYLLECLPTKKNSVLSFIFIHSTPKCDVIFYLFTLPLEIKTIPCLIFHATYRNKRVFPFVTNWADPAPKYSFKRIFLNMNVSLFERKPPLSLDVRSVHFATPKVLEYSIWTYESKGYFITQREKSKRHDFAIS